MKIILLLASIVFITACSKPTDIVLTQGQLPNWAKEGSSLRKLASEAREASVRTLWLRQEDELTRLNYGANTAPESRAIEDVHVDTVIRLKHQMSDEIGTEIFSKATDARPRNSSSDKLKKLITLTVEGKRVSPKNIKAGRLHDEMTLMLEVSTKNNKSLSKLSALVYVYDASGAGVGFMPVIFREQSNRVTMTKYEPVNNLTANFVNSNYFFNFPNVPSKGMSTKFVIESIEYADGESIILSSIN
jgi:hypothetical protein